VAALRESASEGTLWLEGDAASGILGAFGIRSGAPADPAPEAGEVVLEMLPDRSFGPLVAVRRGTEASAVRITPLTDRDVDEIIAAAGLAPGRGFEELFGRISQMIEEIPWLCGIVAPLRAAPSGAEGEKAFLGPGARLGLFTDRTDSIGSAGDRPGAL